MKKFFRILLVIIAILVIAMISIGKHYHYEKSIVINAPAEKIYSHISSTKAINEWNPWLKLDANLKVEYSGESGKIGDKYCWKSERKDVGNGCQEITELIPNKKQSTKMFFEGQGDATSDVILEPQGNATKVTWTFNTEMNYPMNLMKLTMDSQMEKDFGKGLQKLKEISEK